MDLLKDKMIFSYPEKLLSLLNPEEQEQLDQAYVALSGLPLLVLMELAAAHVSQACYQYLLKAKKINLQMQQDQLKKIKIVVFTGNGNNAGDAYAAARHLSGYGFTVSCVEIFPQKAFTSECLQNRKAFLNTGGTCLAPEALEGLDVPDVILDGIFGTKYQIGRQPDAVLEKIQRCVKAWRGQGCYAIAIDIPSGVDASTGEVSEIALNVDLTVTFVRPKVGLVAAPGCTQTKAWVQREIGINQETYTQLLENFKKPVFQITEAWVKGIKNKRDKLGHKGMYGKAALIGGSEKMAGAMILASLAMSKSGLGYSHVAVPKEILALLLESHPSALIEEIPQTIEALQDYLEHKTVGVGCGAGQGSWLKKYLPIFLKEAEHLIFDADALNVLAQIKGWETLCLERYQDKPEAPVILTPHPGEFKRLAQDLTPLLAKDRQKAALTLAKRSGAVVLLKGQATVIALPSGQVAINPTGNQGLAKGGSGDVLTGLLLGLLAQGLKEGDAAAAAAYIHGKTADLIAAEMSERALLPEDILGAMPECFKLLAWEK